MKWILVIFGCLGLAGCGVGARGAGLVPGREVRVLIEVEEVWTHDGSQALEAGDLVVVTDLESRFFRGDRLEVLGKAKLQVRDLSFGREGREYVFFYPEILVVERAGGGGLTEWIGGLQNRFSAGLERGLPEPHGSLLVGILLGLRRSMPQDFHKALVDTGTLHVIAASGFNITIVARVLVSGFSRVFHRRVALLFSFAGIVFYTLLAGASAAVVRAAIMGSLAYGAQLFGRNYLAGWSLVVSAVVMVVVSPEMVSDVGFWLSVTATGGILLLQRDVEQAIFKFSNSQFSNGEVGGLRGLMTFELTPPGPLLQRGGEESPLGAGGIVDPDVAESVVVPPLSKRGLGGVIRSLISDLSTTLAAQVGTTPVLLVVFGRLSLVSPVVNTLVLWLVPPIMFLGAVKLVVDLVLPPLGFLVSLPTYLLLELFVRVVDWFGRTPLASVETSWFSTSWWQGVGFGVVFYGVVGVYLVGKRFRS